MISPNDISNHIQLEKIKEILDNNKAELKCLIQNLSLELTEKINQAVDDVNTLRNQNAALEERVQKLEKHFRKNNIVVYGVQAQEDQRNLPAWIVSLLNDLLGLNLAVGDINNVYFIGDNQKPKRPLMIELTSYITKVSIFRNVYKLKNKNIFVAHDLSRKDRDINKVLVSHLREARSKKLAARIKSNKLYVGDEAFTYEQLLDRETTKPIKETNLEEVFSPPPQRLSVSAPGTPTPAVHGTDSDKESDIYVSASATGTAISCPTQTRTESTAEATGVLGLASSAIVNNNATLPVKSKTYHDKVLRPRIDSVSKTKSISDANEDCSPKSGPPRKTRIHSQKSNVK